MRIRPYGDQGLIIEFEAERSLQTHKKVTSIFEALHKNLLEGVYNIIPAYHSLVISFDALIVSFDVVQRWVNQAYATNKKSNTPNVAYKLPVCYDTSFGFDQISIADRLDLTIDKMIELHVGIDYRIYCIGFMPGFTYLGYLQDPLVGKRLDIPRTIVPKGSVGIAGLQTGIYPADLPGGWEIIGRCPIPTFLPELVEPFPFKIGDSFCFYKISKEEYECWNQKDWMKEDYQQFLV